MAPIIIINSENMLSQNGGNSYFICDWSFINYAVFFHWSPTRGYDLGKNMISKCGPYATSFVIASALENGDINGNGEISTATNKYDMFMIINSNLPP